MKYIEGYQFEVKPVLSTNSELVFTAEECAGTPIDRILFENAEKAIDYLENFLEVVEHRYSYGEYLPGCYEPALEQVSVRTWVVGKHDFVVTLANHSVTII